MFEQLQEKFTRALKNVKGQGKISDSNISETMRDVRRALLEADVNYKVAKLFVNRVTEKARGEHVFTSVTPGQQFVKILQDELTELLGGKSSELKLSGKGTKVLLMAGLQGSGKTTSAVKLARFLKHKRSKNPYLIAADLQRPAAIDQLEVLAEQEGIPVYAQRVTDPVYVVKKGLEKAKLLGHDVVIVDTAGRLHVDDELMRQLQDVVDVAKPDEILYVADGLTGQDAVNSSKAFSEAIEIAGVVLTKMDGDSRGGAAVSVREVTGKPIKFIGTGEGADALEIFHPDRLAQRILGMGDVVTLVEKAQDVVDDKKAEKLAKKLQNNSFTLEDFREQLGQIKKMGSIGNMVKMIPGMNKIKDAELDDNQLKWVEAIINSMTKTERRQPDMINGSRRKRIAKGSGRSVFEVNQLLKQFFQMKKMMRQMKKFGFGKMNPFGL